MNHLEPLVFGLLGLFILAIVFPIAIPIYLVIVAINVICGYSEDEQD